MPTIRRSLALSFAQQYTSLLIMVPTIMVLARYLTPKETGIFSVALALISLVHMLRHFGISEYLIQERNFDRQTVRTAFTITAGMGWVLAAGLYFIAPVVGHFYQQAGVTRVFQVIALNFILIPFSAIAVTLMRREFAYGQKYIINTASSATQSATSIAMAVLGFSYMSLAWGSLAGVVAATIVTAIIRPRDVVMMPSLQGWRKIVSFGKKKVAIDVMNQLVVYGNDMVIGRTLGFAAAGLFSRGSGLINMFNQKFRGAISSVAFPAFASRSREGGDVGALYVKSVSYLTAIAWPFYIFAAIMGRPIILAAYGDQWVQAIPVLRIIAVGEVINVVSLYCGQLQMATGHIKGFLHTRLIAGPLRLALIVAAAFYSIEAVAAVQIVMAFVVTALQYRHLKKYLDIRFTTVLGSCTRSAGIMMTSNVIPVAVLVLALTGKLSNPWIELVIAGLGAGAGWLLGVFMFKHPLREEMETVWGRIREWLSSRSERKN